MKTITSKEWDRLDLGAKYAFTGRVQYKINEFGEPGDHWLDSIYMKNGRPHYEFGRAYVYTNGGGAYALDGYVYGPQAYWQEMWRRFKNTDRAEEILPHLFCEKEIVDI